MTFYKMREAQVSSSKYPPLCVGMLGWDITTIEGSKFKSYGGAVLHYVVAAAIFGIKFKIISYVNLNEWKSLIAGLSNQNIDVSQIINHPENIEFYIKYDEELCFLVNEFKEKIPKNRPDIVENLKKEVHKGQFVHLCPTTPELDFRILETVHALGGCISTQLHIYNLLAAPGSYREILNFVNYIFMNEEEAIVLSGEKNLNSALESLRSYSKTCFYITSNKGVIALANNKIFKCPSIKTLVVDPTGAGDTFAGGCTAGRILTGKHDVALRLGTFCAATKLTNYSSNSLLSLLNIISYHSDDKPFWNEINPL